MINPVSNFSSFIPSVINNISNNISKIAIPLIAIAGFAFIPTTEGGPVLATTCYASCMAAGALLGPGAAIYIPICLEGCMVAMAIPTP